jgi:bidirectional [NiFe] hydrogenase diaphorase subunit
MSAPTPDRSAVTLRIDGRSLQVPVGSTLLQACTLAGIALPTLCFAEGLSAVGACRLCLVTLAGHPRPVAACTTIAAAEMEVETSGEGLELLRRLAVELLFQEGNHVCAFCVATDHCELQALARRLGVDHLRYPAQRPLRRVDASHPRFLLDHNVCILCSRCVRVCAEVEGAHVWELAERGGRTRLVAGLDQPWGSVSACTSCGKCLQLCPTGALATKGLTTGERRADPSVAAALRPTRREAETLPPDWGRREMTP